MGKNIITLQLLWENKVAIVFHCFLLLRHFESGKIDHNTNLIENSILDHLHFAALSFDSSPTTLKPQPELHPL